MQHLHSIGNLHPETAARELLHELRNCSEVQGASLLPGDEGSIVQVHLSRPSPELARKYPEFAGHVVEFAVVTDPKFKRGEPVTAK